MRVIGKDAHKQRQKKALAKLLSTAKNMCMYGIRCKALLNGDQYIQTKTGNFIKSIFDSKYVNENIKNLLFNHNSEYVPNQIDDIYQIIDLINRMKYNDFNEIMNANSQIFKEYEEIQNIKAIEWCKRNKMPLNPEYSIKRYI